MSFELQLLNPTGKDFSLSQQNFFENLSKDISRREKDIPWKQRKTYKLEVAKREQDFVLSLIDVKANATVKIAQINANAKLQDYESQLLFELNEHTYKMALKAAANIVKDAKEVEAIMEHLMPGDTKMKEFIGELTNTALDNVNTIAKMKERTF